MSVKLYSRIPGIVSEAEAKAVKAVEATAGHIEGGAKRRSRVDTGQMRNGWEQQIIDPLARRVANAVGHVIWNEYGTVSMPAQPMLEPSVNENRNEFYEAMRQAYQ